MNGLNPTQDQENNENLQEDSLEINKELNNTSNEYPKDENNRHFSSFYYQKVLEIEKILVPNLRVTKQVMNINLAFQETNEKIYQKGNENFLSLMSCYQNLIQLCKSMLSLPRQNRRIFFRVFTRRKGMITGLIRELTQEVQKRLLDINPRAYYTPCGRHNLNLVLDDMLNHYLKLDGNVELKSEAIRLATYEMENFEFLLGMNIWYDILFAVNFGNGFALALESTKEMTIEMDIEPKFNEKCKIHRKKHFDDIVSDEITHSIENSFHVDYFLYILDQFISSIESRFKQFLEHENMFGFLFDSNKFKTLSEDELKKYYINLEKILSFEDHSDIDDLDLFSK
ncbi:hypothetical protein HKD37_14G041050 [Glycine soja]